MVFYTQSTVTVMSGHDDNVELMPSDVGLTCWGQTVTNACAWFSVTLPPQKPSGSLGRGAQGGHLDFHTAPELCVRVRGRGR